MDLFVWSHSSVSSFDDLLRVEARGSAQGTPSIDILIHYMLMNTAHAEQLLHAHAAPWHKEHIGPVPLMD